MDRRSFGRVSGVVIDVCRPHGAWFDRGKLADIRRFLRDGGLGRYERNRRLARERTTPPPVGGGGASLGDLYDILLGDSGWDVPRPFPRLLAAAIFGIAGAFLVWLAFRSTIFGRPLGVDTLGIGLVALYFGWRALVDWAGRRSR